MENANFSGGSSANSCILLRNILLHSYISGEVRNSLYYIAGTQNKSNTQPVRCVADSAFASKMSWFNFETGVANAEIMFYVKLLNSGAGTQNVITRASFCNFFTAFDCFLNTKNLCSTMF